MFTVRDLKRRLERVDNDLPVIMIDTTMFQYYVGAPKYWGVVPAEKKVCGDIIPLPNGTGDVDRDSTVIDVFVIDAG